MGLLRVSSCDFGDVLFGPLSTSEPRLGSFVLFFGGNLGFLTMKISNTKKRPISSWTKKHRLLTGWQLIYHPQFFFGYEYFSKIAWNYTSEIYCIEVEWVFFFTGIHVLLYCRPGDSIVLCDACCCRADTSLDFTVIADNTSRSRELSLHVCFSPQFLLSLFHFDIVFPSYISNFRLLTRRKKTEERNTIDAIVLFLV